MTLVELSDVTRTVNVVDAEPLHILRGVDLVLEEEERVSIVGRSGSGKSTLLNILGLIDVPTSGEMRFAEEDASRFSSRRRDRVRGASVGFVFQQFNLLEGRTARENVETPLLYARDSTFWKRREIATDMLERVGLGHRLDALPSGLSGGEQQRVAIARALVRAPRLILADEPTGALDIETGAEVMGLIEEIARETGASLVTITHDPAIAARAQTHYRLVEGVLTPDDFSRQREPLVAVGEEER